MPFILTRFKCYENIFVLYDQVGESHRPHFRPGLEGGSSDDELQTAGRNTDTRTGIEHRCSAEGQVINSPITGKVLFIKYKKLCLLNKITGISSLFFCGVR